MEGGCNHQFDAFWWGYRVEWRGGGGITINSFWWGYRVEGGWNHQCFLVGIQGGGGCNHQGFLVGIQDGGWVEPSMLSGGDTMWRRV